ncbi:type II secretion system F family protein [Candidatus Nomurabacteria bacterium]|nr:type II secretion system F family protein [Candidatus Nomurabacteria bacterium]
MEARASSSVIETLQSKGLIVVSVEEDLGIGLNRLTEINLGGIPMKDKVIFMRQLSTMITAGLPLSQALEILNSQATNPLFKKVLSDVTISVQNGTSLADSFRKAEDVFDEITVNLIAAGEESGHLEEILRRLADEFENQKKLKDKIKSAFIYPAVISVVVVAVILILLLVLVPAMEDIYSDFNAELPWVTTFMINLSNIVARFWWLMLSFVLAIVMFVKYYIETPKGKRNFHLLILKLPVFGNLMTKMQVTQFTRVLSLLLKSGLAIIEALQLTADSLSNVLFKEAVLKAKEEVEKGTSMATPIARSEYFPLIVSQMISVGEESGEISMVLEKLSEYYGSEVEVMSGNLTTLLEPVVLIIVGLIIAFIALAVYMPMFTLVNVIG